MTNTNNAAQPGLTDDQIEVLAKKYIAPHAHRMEAIMIDPVPYQQTEQFRRVKALIADVLSKPRAPVEDTPSVDGLMAKWDDDGATRGAAFIELRDLARELERRAAMANTPVVPEYTSAMGEAAEAYYDTFSFAHRLPAQFRWAKVWEVMCEARGAK